MTQKVAIFGGSFNPPHKAHTQVVQYLLGKGFDEVWIMPAYKHAFNKNLLNFEDRIQMCRLAFSDCGSRVLIKETEKELGGVSYTYDLMTHLTKENPGIRFSFVMGSDCKESLHQWYRYEDLKKIVDFFFIPRPGYEDSPFMDISSTELRECLKQNQDISDFVDPKVEKYLKEKSLYGR